MVNKQGKTVGTRLTEEIEFAENTPVAEHQKKLAMQVLGAVNLAAEFGLITIAEWENYTTRIFDLI